MSDDCWGNLWKSKKTQQNNNHFLTVSYNYFRRFYRCSENPDKPFAPKEETGKISRRQTVNINETEYPYSVSQDEESERRS